ncbi:caspase, EACC1-associated type [Actinoplanes philippinensis]|uniref:caspase, EACC1-associated type n=1 Tax=Actinoplanes philippinensis TaxID=35752 RepID=UPI0015A4F833|nr:response regulator [Actinoplanes philippinensis]
MLLVEEDEGDAFLVRELLAEEGLAADVVRVDNVRQALKHLDGVSVILLDIELPDSSGLDGLERIKQHRPDVPVIILTGRAGRGLAEAALQAGADNYLVKGQVDGVLLTQVLQFAVERAGLQRELSALRQAQADLRHDQHRGTSVRLPRKEQSRCLLIGSSRYDDSATYPNLPAVEHNLRRLAEVLADPELGGFAPDRVHVELNPTESIGARLADLAERTEDVFLVYYAGHGLVDEDGELYYGLPSMRPGRIWCTALPHQWIRRAMLNTPATSRVLVLDCCFSGRAIEAMTDADATITGQLDISGAYTLTATSRSRVARAPGGELHTAFTGELLTLLRSGLPGEGPLLPVTAIFSPLVKALLAKDLPRPQQRGTGTIGDLALIRNAAG